MNYITGQSRHQVTLFPDAIDDYIADDNPVQFIDAFVDNLDLRELGFRRAVPNDTGRPSYHPADMLKLYIYGYLHRIRSSRRLEKETQRNVELMWLLRKLNPDFKTIADFRKDNLKAIKNVCREFILLCRRMDLFSAELIAIDGSKFRAVNSGERAYSRNRLKARIRDIDKTIDSYLNALEQTDEDEKSIHKPTAEEVHQKIQQIRQKKRHYQKQLQDLEATGETQRCMSDPDSRLMQTSKGIDSCYNTQIAVDAKHKLIAAQDVINDVVDKNQLSKMALQAKENMNAKSFDAVTDMGYYHGHEVEKCLDAGITPYIPKPYTSANTKQGLYGKERFTYDTENDCYICPAGERLKYRFTTCEKNRTIRYYTATACKQCPLKPKCTRNKDSRRITRWVNEQILEAMDKRVTTNPFMMERRKQLVEHPFGTMKRWMDQGYFLMRGLDKVRTEFSLTVLAYNIKRVINIVGVKNMVAALA